MAYILRDYQQNAVKVALDKLGGGYSKPFILQLATGAGKSLVIADICHKLDKPILIICPSREILLQNYQKMVSYGVKNVSMYSASVGQKEISKLTYATIQSIYRKPSEFKHFEYAIIDECHLLNPKKTDGMLTSFFRTINCTNVIGLTATPYRIDTLWTRTANGDLYANASLKMVNRISHTPFFKSIEYQMETKELIEMGYLSPIKYFVDRSDWSILRLNTTGANFTDKSVKEFSENRSRIDRIVDAVSYSDKNNKRTLIFCSTLAQSRKLVDRMDLLGIKTVMVSGETPLKERADLIEDFKQGKVRHLFNVGVFTTGFDMPVLDCIILARPTMSLALYYQMVGRGVRLDPENKDKVLQVYDLVGIVPRLGRVETIRIQKEAGGFRDEVWSEVGRMDNKPLYSFKIPKKIDKDKKKDDN